MGDQPSSGQLSLLIGCIAVFVVGAGAALLRWRRGLRSPGEPPSRALRLVGKVSLYAGLALCLGVIAWHSMARHNWRPLEDNFSTFLWLAALLALFIAYSQRAHPLRGLDLFVLPVVVLLAIMAAIFGETRPHEYRETTWSIAHRLTAYGGFVAFAIAGAVGTMYLIADHRLRSKKVLSGPGVGSLERLEHTTLVSVTLGFALLSIGLLTGLLRVLEPHAPNSLGPQWYRNPKVVLACVAWVVYALVMHSPINPAFRGRRNAMLSVIGFVLMVCTFVAVQFMPSR